MQHSLSIILILLTFQSCTSFIPSLKSTFINNQQCKLSSTSTTTEETISFIDTELRKAAMKLHTRKQAPKEGEAPEKKVEPYVTKLEDYLQFLVDSQHVYSTFEDIIKSNSELVCLENTGLERTDALEVDIEFIMSEYGLVRPPVGKWGVEYAQLISEMQSDIPIFVCHYYNHYFAHTAGGRMIGKQMSALLLDKKELEFYKWNGDINKIKETVKATLEQMISQFSIEGKQACIDATADTFRFGGGLMSYLSGGRSMGH